MTTLTTTLNLDQVTNLLDNAILTQDMREHLMNVHHQLWLDSLLPEVHECPIESIELGLVDHDFVPFNELPKIDVAIEYEYTDEDYTTQAAALGLCPTFSLTYAEMKAHSFQAGWDAHANNESSFKTRIKFSANSFKAVTYATNNQSLPFVIGV